MTDIFEYDVFLSFAISDEQVVKPIWQELCLSGLRVFWSDAALKSEIGNSWFEIIQSSLEKSRHLLLVCSTASMTSKWVKREYSAFYNHCYNPDVRRLVPILIQGYKISDLPLFFKDIEARQLEKPNSIKEIISIFGGMNIEGLKSENLVLKQNIRSLSEKNSSLESKVRNLNKLLKKQEQKNEASRETKSGNLPATKSEINDGESQSVIKDDQLKKEESFRYLGLTSEASSQQIVRRFETLKVQYEAILSNCPKGLKEVCELRIIGLEDAFELIFSTKRKEEIEKINRAFEVLQLQETAKEKEITERFNELKASCLKAMRTSDVFIKETAAVELEKLEESVSLLTGRKSLVEVIMPQFGEDITEGIITKWLKQEGESVKKDESLFEISTDKVDAEVPSPAAGVIEEILFSEGETVEANIAVAVISVI